MSNLHALFVWLYIWRIRKVILSKKIETKKRRNEHGMCVEVSHYFLVLSWIIGDTESEGSSHARKSNNHAINKENAV